jgi:tetratricopeptide (TPR) repeat protein
MERTRRCNLQTPSSAIERAWGEETDMPDEFCGACGRQGRPNDRFCRGCGESLTGEVIAGDPIREAESLAVGGHLTEAVATVLREIGAHDSAALRVALATLYLRRCGAGDAARELDRAIELDPGCAVAHAYRGALLVRLGRVDEAEEALDLARDLAPDDLLVTMKRAEYFIVLGVLGRACDELRHGLSEGGGDPDLRETATRTLAEVEQRLRGSITRHPANLPRLGLGRLFGRTHTDTALNTTKVEA